jgi:hypothetical protein
MHLSKIRSLKNINQSLGALIMQSLAAKKSYFTLQSFNVPIAPIIWALSNARW